MPVGIAVAFLFSQSPLYHRKNRRAHGMINAVISDNFALRRVAVFCGSAGGSDPAHRAAAETFAALLPETVSVLFMAGRRAA